MRLFTLNQLTRTQAFVYEHLKQTPQYAWPLLCAELGAEVWVKHENHTPTGAFKVRGGLVYLNEASKSGSRDDLVTATRGNHGQSIPYAARLYGRTAQVFVPKGNSLDKNAAMQAWGAQLHVVGHDFDAARQAAEQFASDRDLQLIPSFHEHLVRGVATYAKELFDAVADLATVYVPVGLGSGASGLILVRDLLGLTTEIVGVVSSAADAVAQSIECGREVQTATAKTFADGVAVRVPNADSLAILQSGLSRIVRVTDDEIADAMRLLYRTTHNVAEGAGAVATAALKQEQQHQRGKKVAVILTGGNIDGDLFTDVMSGNTPTE